MRMKKVGVMLLSLGTVLACGDDDAAMGNDIAPGEDPNFTIVAHSDEGLGSFNRKVVVFGIDIYAVASVNDSKLLHAANLLAQYLDNDENGEVDDQNVLDAMLASQAFMVMWATESDLDIDPPSGRVGQDLGNDETRPQWHASRSGEFDAALEEVWHIVSHAGYSQAYPEVFGESPGTALADAMDQARGGRFTEIPNPYPAGAWYTYDDETCDYSCMATEYFYWAVTSILGAQANRLEEIEHEWRLNTTDKVREGDPVIYQLLTDDQYILPAVLPDGTYRH